MQTNHCNNFLPFFVWNNFMFSPSFYFMKNPFVFIFQSMSASNLVALLKGVLVKQKNQLIYFTLSKEKAYVYCKLLFQYSSGLTCDKADSRILQSD